MRPMSTGRFAALIGRSLRGPAKWVAHLAVLILPLLFVPVIIGCWQEEEAQKISLADQGLMARRPAVTAAVISSLAWEYLPASAPSYPAGASIIPPVEPVARPALLVASGPGAGRQPQSAQHRAQRDVKKVEETDDRK